MVAIKTGIENVSFNKSKAIKMEIKLVFFNPLNTFAVVYLQFNKLLTNGRSLLFEVHFSLPFQFYQKFSRAI
jgi:hypothetical protein